ncbi:hypothetical protein Hanom_Chr08g00694211 [Helianthus anomalus]
MLGNGSSVQFWGDTWAENGALKYKYPALFTLEKDKCITVWDKACLRGNTLEWSWDWSRQPTSSLEISQLSELQNMLNQDCLSNTPDVWKWINEDGQNFSVKDLRIELANLRYKKEEDLVFEWNAWATPKASYLGWRALMGKSAFESGLFR